MRPPYIGSSDFFGQNAQHSGLEGTWGQEENVGGRADKEHGVAETNWQANKGGGRTGRGSPSGAI